MRMPPNLLLNVFGNLQAEVGDEVGIEVNDANLEGGSGGAAVLAETVLVPVPLDMA